MSATGTYISFYADPALEPGETDLKYYELLRSWRVREQADLRMVASLEKTQAAKDIAKRGALESSLRGRIQDCRSMVLIIGKTTKMDLIWIPLEVRTAVAQCGLPIIAAYPGQKMILNAESLREFWPPELLQAIDDVSARVIHVPFSREPLVEAVKTYSVDSLPPGPLTCFPYDAYASWGLNAG